MAKKQFNPLTPPFDLTADSVSDLIDHTKAVHDALLINADTLDGKHASDMSLISAGAGVNLFYSNVASDIGGYETIDKTPDFGAEQDESVIVNNNTVLFERYASPSAGLGGTQIDMGKWTFEIYAYASTAVGTNELLIDVYKRTAAGAEALLFSVTTGDIDATAISLYTINTVQPAFPINATDRLVAKVSGKTNNAVDTTIHFIHSGTTHYSNIHTPLVTRHNDLAGLQGGASAEYYHLTSAEHTVVQSLSTARTITFIIDGGGFVITTGVKGFIEIPFACTIVGWTLVANASGSIVIDVWKDTYANFPPTVLDTITGTEKPTLVSVQKNQDTALTTWITAINAGDILAFNVDSVATVQRVTISLKVIT